MGEEVGEDPAVSRFREYLRINTTSSPTLNPSAPIPDYEGAIEFLSRQADEIGLQKQAVQVCEGRKVLVLTWVGSDPALPSLLLNSHMDVVPVFPECWESDPFGAHKRSNGDIVARGTQDMKCVGMWYLEAIRRLKVAGTSLLRTVHLTFVPDEEVGGEFGMREFVRTDFFKGMNVGYCLDEGLANPGDAYTVFYGERDVWFFDITCTGKTGHGSRFIEDTAVEKMHKLLALILGFRDKQKKRLYSDPSLTLSDVTSLNVNVVTGGLQHNVIPTEFTIKVDMRITPSEKFEDMEKMVEGWMEAVGGGCKLSTFYHVPGSPVEVSTDPSDPWWAAFTAAVAKHGVKLEAEIFSAATDSRYIRSRGIPALGFSAIRKTPILLHDHNEFLNQDRFLEGIDVYQTVIQNLANVRT